VLAECWKAWSQGEEGIDTDAGILFAAEFAHRIYRFLGKK